MNTFCAINIFGGDQNLLNKDLRPIMYIWDGESDLKTSLSTEQFYNYIGDKTFELFEFYCLGKISTFTYKKEEFSEAEYEEYDFLIQEIFPISEYKTPLYSIIYNVMNRLYNKAFDDDYDLKDYNDDFIFSIYKKIKSKYPKLTDETITQAVRSELQVDELFKSLTNDNREYIINHIKNTIQNK